MSYQSMEEAYARCDKEGIELWKAFQLEDCDERNVSEAASWKMMKGMWQAMIDGLADYEPGLMSGSGLVGAEGGLMQEYNKKISHSFQICVDKTNYNCYNIPRMK